jgi:hypothetical protein
VRAKGLNTNLGLRCGACGAHLVRVPTYQRHRAKGLATILKCPDYDCNGYIYRGRILEDPIM